MRRTNGVHFLTDYYALLGLNRFETDPAVIQHAYDAFRRRHRPRKRQSKSAATEAARQLRLGAVAHNTLNDERKKREYDALLAGWEGPISDDGTPVIRITDPLWRAPVLKNERVPHPTSDQIQQIRARVQAGDDPSLLEHLRRGRLLSGQAAILYFVAAARHLEYWICRIELRRHADGRALPNFKEGGIRAQLAAIHEKEAGQAETAWEELETGIREGAIRALPAGDTTLEAQRALAREAFASTTDAVLGFAQQYDTLLDELAQPLYAPQQDVLHPNVVLVLYVGDQVVRFAYRFEGEEPQLAEELSESQLEALDAPEEAAQLIANGWNIVYAFHPYGSDPMAFVESVLRSHYANVQANHRKE